MTRTPPATTPLLEELRILASALTDLDRRFAVVGGIAVSVRAEPRFTKDLDLAVVVADDEDAETLAAQLGGAGYRIAGTVEQTALGRLSTVRFVTNRASRVRVDLLFASSGIEAEVVSAAELLDVGGGVSAPVARPEHLAALKLLSHDARRPKDWVDLVALRPLLGNTELRELRRAAKLIEERGFARGKDLSKAVGTYLAGVPGSKERRTPRPRRR